MKIVFRLVFSAGDMEDETKFSQTFPQETAVEEETQKCLGEPTPYEGITTDKVLFSRSETISNLQRFLWVTFQLVEKVLHKL